MTELDAMVILYGKDVTDSGGHVTGSPQGRGSDE